MDGGAVVVYLSYRNLSFVPCSKRTVDKYSYSCSLSFGKGKKVYACACDCSIAWIWTYQPGQLCVYKDKTGKIMILKKYSCNHTDHNGHAVFNKESVGSSIMRSMYVHLSLFLLCFAVISRCRP